MKETRIYGPPGTGKTTRLATQSIPAAVDKFGPKNVIVTSFTRAAAKEIASKRSLKTGEPVNLPQGNVGTLHSLCFHALGRPNMVDAKAVREWNDTYGDKYQIGGGMVDDENVALPGDDKIVARVEIRRAKMIPESRWTNVERTFYSKWKAFKDKKGLMDFSDLIETALAKILYPPNSPQVMFVDEAQDLTPIQHKLVQSWGRHLDHFVMVGDDDQCQPPDTEVLCNGGARSIRICDLDPKCHRLVCFDANKGFSVDYFGSYQVASRFYDGMLVRITLSDGREVGATSDHRWFYKVFDKVFVGASVALKPGMLLPTFVGCGYGPVGWVGIREVRIDRYCGYVYSLGVPAYKSYTISNGVMTHNCLYRFSGAMPENFIGKDLPASQKIILDQSYRVPKAVLDCANQMISRVQTREPKQYRPRIDPETGSVAQGLVEQGQAGFKHPEDGMEEISAALATGKSVMVLTSCAYMLNPLKELLRKEGIPFANPYRKERGDWNPLNGETGTARMLHSFLSGNGDYWSIGEMLAWVKHLKVGQNGLVRKKGSAAIKALEESRQEGLMECSSEDVVEQILSPAAFEHAMDRDLGWFVENLLKAKKNAVEFPKLVYERNGPGALVEPPKLIIGTVHSVKGGEADVVFLYPDISYSAHMERIRNPDAEDQLYRLFYVGMTRARERLVLMPPCVKKPGGRGMFIDF